MANDKIVTLENLECYHGNINEVISNKANADHTHDEYVTTEGVEQMIAEAIEVALNTEY